MERLKGDSYGKRGDSVWVEVDYRVDEEGSIEARGYMEAPGRGDQAMDTLRAMIQTRADALGEDITHVFTAMNKGAKTLIEKNPDYVCVGEDDLGYPLYRLRYKPQR